MPKLQNVTAIREVLSISVVFRLINEAKTLRMFAYFWTVYTMGLRLNEALHLEVTDIKADRHCPNCGHEKTQAWTSWLASSHAPQAEKLTAAMKCRECRGEMRVVGVTYSSLGSQRRTKKLKSESESTVASTRSQILIG